MYGVGVAKMEDNNFAQFTRNVCDSYESFVPFSPSLSTSEVSLCLPQIAYSVKCTFEMCDINISIVSRNVCDINISIVETAKRIRVLTTLACQQL